MTEEEIQEQFTLEVKKAILNYMDNYVSIAKNSDNRLDTNDILENIARLEAVVGTNDSSVLEEINKKLAQIRALSVL